MPFRTQLQDTRQKDRSQEWFHSVKSFCFYWIPNYSHCEWFLAKFIRHSWITSDEKNVNKPLRRTLRDESLGTNTARDLEQVVRIFQEAKLHSAKFCSPVSPSSTPRMWDIALRNGTLENPSQCEGFETKEKERETFCKILHSAKDLGVGITICIKV